jgi:hypothetical protein
VIVYTLQNIHTECYAYYNAVTFTHTQEMPLRFYRNFEEAEECYLRLPLSEARHWKIVTFEISDPKGSFNLTYFLPEKRVAVRPGA